MPRKRKINATSDEELMPPPQMPVPKKHKSTKQSTSSTVNNDSIISDITNISNTSTQQTQNKCGPLSLIFEKAQQNESLHNKYFKELTNIYEKVCATPIIDFFQFNFPYQPFPSVGFIFPPFHNLLSKFAFVDEQP